VWVDPSAERTALATAKPWLGSTPDPLPALGGGLELGLRVNPRGLGLALTLTLCSGLTLNPRVRVRVRVRVNPG